MTMCFLSGTDNATSFPFFKSRLSTTCLLKETLRALRNKFQSKTGKLVLTPPIDEKHLEGKGVCKVKYLCCTSSPLPF